MASTDLAVERRYLDGTAVEAVALAPDGRTLYALTAAGTIVKLDTATGRVVGSVPGNGYDRLVAVVPW